MNEACGLSWVTGHDSWKETFLLRFSNVVKCIGPIILKRRQKTLQVTPHKLSRCIKSTTGQRKKMHEVNCPFNNTPMIYGVSDPAPFKSTIYSYGQDSLLLLTLLFWEQKCNIFCQQKTKHTINKVKGKFDWLFCSENLIS